MLPKNSLFLGAALFTAILVPGCNKTPTGPSTIPNVISQPPGSPPAPQSIGTWNLTVRATESDGKGKQCVIDSLRADINTHNQYSLSIVQKGDRSEATLASASDDFVCTYPVEVDSTGFTEGSGYYSCERERRVVLCDGTQHSLSTLGQTISGRFSGNEVNGEWSAFWVDMIDDEEEFDLKAQFTGSK